MNEERLHAEVLNKNIVEGDGASDDDDESIDSSLEESAEMEEGSMVDSGNEKNNRTTEDPNRSSEGSGKNDSEALASVAERDFEKDDQDLISGISQLDEEDNRTGEEGNRNSQEDNRTGKEDNRTGEEDNRTDKENIITGKQDDTACGKTDKRAIDGERIGDNFATISQELRVSDLEGLISPGEGKSMGSKELLITIDPERSDSTSLSSHNSTAQESEEEVSELNCSTTSLEQSVLVPIGDGNTSVEILFSTEEVSNPPLQISNLPAKKRNRKRKSTNESILRSTFDDSFVVGNTSQSHSGAPQSPHLPDESLVVPDGDKEESPINNSSTKIARLQIDPSRQSKYETNSGLSPEEGRSTSQEEARSTFQEEARSTFQEEARSTKRSRIQKTEDKRSKRKRAKKSKPTRTKGNILDANFDEVEIYEI